MRIFLIGYRCTGKTAVGKRLAERKGFGFVDTDAEVVRRTGLSVAGMVAQKGWPRFREIEKSVLSEISRQPDRVVATGGGIVLDPENVETMKKSGTLVWLQAAPETVRRRMAADPDHPVSRPGLTGNGSLAEIEAVLLQRLPLYKAAADIAVDTDHSDIDGVCEAVLTALSE